ncbi:MAG: type III-B CRISPR module RAMP protein Cmr1 [Candidatus Helarchaeota archaeon]
MKFFTKTPLWTGDIDQNCSTIQPMGLIGSVRWWNEAVLRSLDYFVCDPTNNNKNSCSFKCPTTPTERNKTNYFCISCILFGTQNWRRIFQLKLQVDDICEDNTLINIKPKSRTRGWYIKKGFNGRFNIKLIQLHNFFKNEFIYVPLLIASKWGSIGAKTQLGYGVFQFEKYPKINVSNYIESLKELCKTFENLNKNYKIRKNVNESSLPNLKNFFFSKIQFDAKNSDWWTYINGIYQLYNEKNKSAPRNERDKRFLDSLNYYKIYPSSPAIKNWLRFGESNDGNDVLLSFIKDINERNKIKDFLFGTIRGEKKSSKINVSWIYPINENKFEFRIWGWIPQCKITKKFDRDKFLDNLQEKLKKKDFLNYLMIKKGYLTNLRLVVWREFNSNRDMVTKKISNIEEYLQSLING